MTLPHDIMTLAHDIPLNTEWREIDARAVQAALDAAKAPGWNPRITKLDGNEIAIDYAFNHGVPADMNVVVLQDHPFLQELRKMPSVPKVVLSLYTANMRLRYTTAKDAFAFVEHCKSAYNSWAEYSKGGNA